MNELVDLWANFLFNERVKPKDFDDPMLLVTLCEKLAAIRGPRVRPHSAKQECRKLVVQTAMDLGIDLSKYNIARSLLDAWNQEYKERFGDSYGTKGWREDLRRKARVRSKKRP